MKRIILSWCWCWCFTLFSPGVLPAMPPHPSLQGLIAQGKVRVPSFFTDPARRAERAAAKMAVAKAAVAATGTSSPVTKAPLLGNVKALAVLVDFSDKEYTVNATFFDSLIFSPPVASGLGSVRDFFSKCSYGQVDIYTVNLPSSLGWQRAPNTYAYYVGTENGTSINYPNNCQRLAEEIVDALEDAGVDFSQYDNNQSGVMSPIMIIHAGQGAEVTYPSNDIWSHSWSLRTSRYYDGVVISDYVIMPEYWFYATSSTSDMTIGVYAHEMGHGFWDLPDLYDTTYSSKGLGDWSLMASGSWNGPSWLGAAPAWPDAWSRVQMGFVTPTEITGTITSKSIPQAYNNPAPAQTVLKLRTPVLGSKEYFLVENRQRTANTYDYYLPGGGLLIYHVDEAMTSNDHACTVFPPCSCSSGNHYLVALQQANGLLQLEKNISYGDDSHPFPGSTNNRNWSMTTNPRSGSWYTCSDTSISVTNISNSGATMTADIQCGAAAISLNSALDNTQLGFSTSGDANWFGESATSYYGGSAAQSGAITANQSTQLVTTVTGPGTLSFYWKVSSEKDPAGGFYDYLGVWLDSTLKSYIDGDVDWTKVTLSIPAGPHTVTWKYSKDAFVDYGSDCGWLDQVVYTPISVSSSKRVIAPILQLLLDSD